MWVPPRSLRIAGGRLLLSAVGGTRSERGVRPHRTAARRDSLSETTQVSFRKSALSTFVASTLVASAMLPSGCGPSQDSAEVSLSGSGASFPSPLYTTWFGEYRKAHPTVRIDYTSKGSSGGIKDVMEGVVDFGASDAAMTDAELEEVARLRGRGVRMLPMTAGAVVIVYNLAGVSGLRIPRETLASIYLGEITRWDDPRLVAANPDIALPDLAITEVHRADGSGTTYAFTNHLASISDAWANGPGVTTSPNWPAEGGIGAKKNDGVAAMVKQTPGAIGYVELSFANQSGLPTALLQNRAGKFVPAAIPNIQAALAGTELPANLRLFLPDPAGADSYPIVTYTWLLAYESYPAAKLAALQEVLKWCLTDGQRFSERLGYAPLPDAVASRVIEVVGSLHAE
ncbi:MAG: phosphate ABC transporter substrate-binding protein PstS [Planctomycetes bacterium]|nr:phosphate ABC transporter substrate-binding protein PstS [Planctomycetota bacterium]